MAMIGEKHYRSKPHHIASITPWSHFPHPPIHLPILFIILPPSFIAFNVWVSYFFMYSPHGVVLFIGLSTFHVSLFLFYCHLFSEIKLCLIN